MRARSGGAWWAGWVLGAVLAGQGRAWASFVPVTCRNGFSEAQEITEGNKVAAQVYRQMPVLPESDEVTRYVQALGAKLARVAPLAPGVSEQWPFNFHVVASAEINAFALPGGSIFVNLGTVQAAESEAQLAGVMAHEISHVVMRHSTCNMARQQRKGLLYGLGAIGSAVLLGNGTMGGLAQAGIGMGQSLDMLHMSRGDESQADLLGVDILYDAGYDPRGLPQFFETIQAKYGSGGAQFLSDHPNPGNRTEAVNAEIATLPPRTGATVSTAEFKRVHAIAVTEKVFAAKEIAGGGWRATGRYASGPGSDGAVVLAPTGTASGDSGGSAAAAGAAMPALARGALGLGDAMVAVQASRFALRAPASWQQSTDAAGVMTLAPAGGAGSGGLAYGAVVGLKQEGGDGIRSEAELAEATRSLVAQLAASASPVAAATSMTVAGRRAQRVELRGSSPVAEGGVRLAERDWVVTVARADGDLSYLVFVAPERDFSLLEPVFRAMLESFRPE